MSFYLGTDNNGNKILHLAAGSKSIADMKVPSVDTVFHSNLEYLTFIAYPGTLSMAANNYKLLTVAASDRLSIGSKAIIIVDSNGNIANSSLRYYYVVYPYSMSSEFEGIWKDATSMYLVPDSTTVAGPCTVYAVNIINGAYVPPPKLSNDIILSGSSISVNGISLTDFNYIHSVPINQVDATATYGSHVFQMVNSHASGGMSIVSNSTYSSIIKGGHALFSTISGRSIRYLFSTTIISPSSADASITYTFPVPVSTNAFIALVPFYETNRSDTTVILPIGLTGVKYAEWYIAFPAFGALQWAYDTVSSTSTTVTITRKVISATGGGSGSNVSVYISVFG